METQSLREFVFNPKPKPVINIIIIVIPFNLPVFQSELLPFHQLRTTQKVAPIRIPLRALISGCFFFDSLFLLQGFVVPLKRCLYFFLPQVTHLPICTQGKSPLFEKHFTALCYGTSNVTTSKLLTAITTPTQKKTFIPAGALCMSRFLRLGGIIIVTRRQTLPALWHRLTL